MSNDPIDQILNKDPLIINNKFATVFSNWGVTVFLLFLVGSGIYSIVNYKGIPIAGFIFLVVGFGGLTFNYGTSIDLNNNRYREYTSIYFMKFGKWNSLNRHPYITILRTNKGRTASAGLPMSATNAAFGSMDYSDGEFAIYLLNETHYSKIEIELFDDINEAKSKLEHYALQLNKKIVQYNPVRLSKYR